MADDKKDITLDDLANMMGRGFQELRTDMQGGFKEVREEMGDGLKEVRKEMGEGFEMVDACLGTLEDDVREIKTSLKGMEHEEDKHLARTTRLEARVFDSVGQ